MLRALLVDDAHVFITLLPCPLSLENRIERAYGDLEMLRMYPSLDPLPLSVSNHTTKHKEKAYARSLQYRVSEVWQRAVLQGSPE